MENYMDLVVQFLRDEGGQDMVEHVLIMGLVSILAVIAVVAAGLSIQTLWKNISTNLAAL